MAANQRVTVQDQWTLLLPNMEKIFLYSGEEDLWKFMKLCQEYRDIICTPRFMRRLPVIFTSAEMNAKKKFIEEHGSIVTILKLSQCEITMTEVRGILELCSNVEVLHIDRCKVMRSDMEAESPINLPRLTSLKLYSSNMADVVQMIDCPNLRSLKLSNLGTAVSSLTEFICQLEHLKELSFDGCNSALFEDLFSNGSVKFRLKKLSIKAPLKEINSNRNFSNFLESQSRNLRELEMSKEVDFHYHLLIFESFRNMKKLKVDVSEIARFAGTLTLRGFRILSLKELDVAGEVKNLECFAAVLQIFPNLESLKIQKITKDVEIHEPLSTLTELRHLRFGELGLKSVYNMKLPSLKVLEIECLNPTSMGEWWKKLGENCEGIERLTIKIDSAIENYSCELQITSITENIKHFTKLQYFEVDCLKRQGPNQAIPLIKVNNFPGEQCDVNVMSDILEIFPDKKNELVEAFNRL